MLPLLGTILLTLNAALAATDLQQRPPAFAFGQGEAQFVDFQEARYSLRYDVAAQSASVKAHIKFLQPAAGHPVFDLVEEPTQVLLDGRPVSAVSQRTPDRATTVRVVGEAVEAGEHVLEVEVPLTTLIEFTETGVKSAFWVTDLEDRYYLERFIPVNLEYDRVKMSFELDFPGLKAPQHIMANGHVEWLSQTQARVVFPEHFTVNSLFFHTTPVGTQELLNFDFTSMNGNLIPVVIYEAKGMSEGIALERYKELTLRVLAELESDYGAFPHPSVTIHVADLSSMGLGGMEYAGATVTNYYALAHELFHSYFARGVAPANGNAGWIDEALASWRDDGYLRVEELKGRTTMAAHPPYTRKTDTRAYSFGPSFMGFLDHHTASRGGLKPFLRHLLAEKLFVPITTEEFVALMQSYYQSEEFSPWFDTYIYGRVSAEEEKSLEKALIPESSHPIHRKMGHKELHRLL